MINIAILGFGVVGSGVAQVIAENADSLSERLCGEKLNVKHILDLRDFPDHPLGDRVTKDFDTILNDEEVLIVVETMGGSHPAYDFSKKALEAGKSVVTSNKEVVANFGAELLAIAREKGVSYLFEASVGGGIPIIRPMWQCLAANKILAVDGILNGTTNYILTKMFAEGWSFEDALAKAQELGYAERNPAADVEGLDTCRKISILASLAYGKAIDPAKVHCEGITAITAADVAAAEEFDYRIKLLGRCADVNGKVYAITAPFLVPDEASIANIDDVYNGISVMGNAVGDVMFYGRGAGALPTASAVMADVLDVIRDCRKTIGWGPEDPDAYCDYESAVMRFMVCADSAEDIEKVFEVESVEVRGKFYAITNLGTERALKEKVSSIDGARFIRVME
ncbi:MAG: homoserine dehydrogenase [Ruminococcaceae bacterium]|nr:homoserine dehydrogenase [Oscillospiraceae bacterium]